MGRPSKLTPQLQNRILKLIEAGCFADDAAFEVGISEATYHDWLRRGRLAEQPYADFLEAVTRARAKARNVRVKRMLRGDSEGRSFGAGRASLEYLSRTQPKRWSQRVSVKVEEELGDFLDKLERELDRETYLKVLSVAERLEADSDEFEPLPGEQPEH